MSYILFPNSHSLHHHRFLLLNRFIFFVVIVVMIWFIKDVIKVSKLISNVFSGNLYSQICSILSGSKFRVVAEILFVDNFESLDNRINYIFHNHHSLIKLQLFLNLL